MSFEDFLWQQVSTTVRNGWNGDLEGYSSQYFQEEWRVPPLPLEPTSGIHVF